VQLRVRSTINLVGDLWCEGGNIFSYGTVIHCAESIRIEQWAGNAEYVTIADSAHFHTEPDRCVSENTVTSPIVIGKNVFIAPRVSVGKGVTIGDFAVVGPNSTLIHDVKPGTLVSGVPAEFVRDLDLPWEHGG
jgi:acetyltransferase-like isoleucine patch superfamily enzyme